MKKILIGTHNEGKFKEISYLLSKNIKKISPVKLKIKSPKETGKTFSSNSKLKAKYFSKFSNLPVISDDSGICIKALGNQPGIYSARWAKKHGSFLNAMKYILRKMRTKKDRSATFVCSLSFKYPKKKIITVIGKIKGKISYKIRGIRGFGYDPIFIPRSKTFTFGEMSKFKKINMDHRYIAFKKLKNKIKIL
ncbi:MAG: RdgB/HAM1 family non-canonical purine NTP pyrophosphatase [Candidatus Pelagibacter sp. TMED263]|nr:MAG: RdgB/HAM1 family non-canonical purine NTP pyrophosphatase [Candidatus Pelagibacter sp. TMED263]|tara:strand:+ start:2586 stop:3164 length:579 start_codon:yes stop_codon:yes gene_type:complete